MNYRARFSIAGWSIVFWAMVAVVWFPVAATGESPGAQTNDSRPGGTDVGVWYCTYYGDDWSKVGGMGYVPCLYRPLCSGKPGDFRAYNATDTDVIDFHLEQLAKAKVSFLLFELTPGGLGGYRPPMKPFVDNARVVAERLARWNAQHPWKLRYAIAAGSHPDVHGDGSIGLCMEKEAQDIYESFYTNASYGGPESYYHLDGKPLVVYWGGIGQNRAAWEAYEGDKTFGERFSVRYAQDVTPGSYGWNIYKTGTVVHPEVEVVSPGWGHYTRESPPYVERQHGDFYRKCWDTVLANPRPKIVMIVAFNDYLENTAVWTADTAALTDADKWTEADGTPNPSMYWDITVEKIKALRGE